MSVHTAYLIIFLQFLDRVKSEHGPDLHSTAPVVSINNMPSKPSPERYTMSSTLSSECGDNNHSAQKFDETSKSPATAALPSLRQSAPNVSLDSTSYTQMVTLPSASLSSSGSTVQKSLLPKNGARGAVDAATEATTRNHKKIKGFPKPALTGYHFFFREFKCQKEQLSLLLALPENKTKPLTRIAAEQWQQLSRENKQGFNKLAAQDNLRFGKEVAAWRELHGKPLDFEIHNEVDDDAREQEVPLATDYAPLSPSVKGEKSDSLHEARIFPSIPRPETTAAADVNAALPDYSAIPEQADATLNFALTSSLFTQSIDDVASFDRKLLTALAVHGTPL
jgi:hypothetical protein